jgi:hypothetical protein
MAKGKEQGSAGMDITQSRQTWLGFLKVTKWSVIVILLIMGLMAIFRVH